MRRRVVNVLAVVGAFDLAALALGAVLVWRTRENERRAARWRHRRASVVPVDAVVDHVFPLAESAQRMYDNARKMERP